MNIPRYDLTVSRSAGFDKLAGSYMRTALRFLATTAILVVCGMCASAQNTFVYTNNNPSVGPNSVSGFSVGPGGVLTPIAGSPFSTGGVGTGASLFAVNRISIAAISGFLYVSNARSGDISAFAISPVTGFLSPVPGSPFPASGASPDGYSLAVTHDGKFLFAANSDSGAISAFKVGANGSLSLVVGAPFFGGSRVDGIKASPNGKFLATDLPDANSIGMWAIAGDGSLTAVPGSPFPVAGTSEITGIDISPGSNFLFASEATGGPTVVAVLSIASNGVLTQIPGSPFTFEGVNSNVPLLSPDGKFLFVSNQFTSGLMGSITVLNVAADGSLSEIPGSPFANPGGFFPAGMDTDLAGKLLFAANDNDRISVFSVAADGSLLPVPGSPFPTGGGGGSLESLAVYTGSFDRCMKDNTTGDVFEFSSVTGAYKYTRCSDRFTISGTGTIRTVGGVLTLTDNKPDRRVSAGFLIGQKTGRVTIDFAVSQGVFQVFSINDTTSFGTGCVCGS